jgi:hypothetical protein
MDWRLSARRWLISSFLIVHISAVLIWVMPGCPIRQRMFGLASCYILPLGLWQAWAMFAPNPARDSVVLEAEIIDAKGMRHIHPFTSLAHYSWYSALPRYRHFKFAYNVSLDEFATARKFVARHALRSLDLGEDVYPVRVSLMYQVTPAPPDGVAVRDPMAPKPSVLVDAFDFRSRKEVGL